MRQALERTVDAILGWLERDWDRVLRLTSVEQAQAALGLARDPAVRRRVGARLAAEPDRHPVVRRWGFRALTLSAAEKRLALWLARLGGPGQATVAEAAAALGWPAREVHDAARLLAWARLLDGDGPDPTGPDAAWRLVPDHADLIGPQGLAVHAVRLEAGDWFSVPCARDVLLLVAVRYPDRRVVADDLCPVCATPIRVTFDRGQVVAASPAGTVYLRGGT